VELYAKTSLIAIYWLEDIRTGYGIWTGMPRLDTAKEALALAEELINQKRSYRWISNTEGALVAPPEAFECIAAWLQRMGRAKTLRAWADIPPKSATARLAVKNLGVESQLHSIIFAQFAGLAEAKLWIAAK
jgi:hypothetical protein